MPHQVGASIEISPRDCSKREGRQISLGESGLSGRTRTHKSPRDWKGGYWSETPTDEISDTNTLKNMLTCRTPKSLLHDRCGDATVDGGMTGTAIGIKEYHQLIEEMDIVPMIDELASKDPEWHVIGIHGNSSEQERITGVTFIPIPCVQDRSSKVRTLVIDGRVPFMVAKPTLRESDAIEEHGQNYLNISYNGIDRVRLRTYTHDDGHARLPIRKEHVFDNVAKACITSLVIVPSTGSVS